MRNILIIFLTCCLIGCSNESSYKVPEGLLSEDTLRQILLDMHIADATLNSLNLKSQYENFTPEGYYNKVLQKHNLTREIFDSSIAFYSRKPEHLDKLYESVLNELSTMEAGFKEVNTENPFHQVISGPVDLEYYFDFELKTNSIFDRFTNTLISYTGSKCMIINSENQYGPAIEHKIKRSVRDIVITSEFYMRLHDTINKKSYPIMLATIEANNVFVRNQKLDLKNKVEKGKEWSKVQTTMRIDYPEDLDEGELNFYILNNGGMKIFIDELSVKIAVR